MTRPVMPRDAEQPQEDPAEIPPGQIYVNADQLARRFGVNAKWVNERKDHLGATPISDSANSKLRYHLPTADAYMENRRLKPAVKQRRSPSKRRPSSGGPGLVQFV